MYGSENSLNRKKSLLERSGIPIERLDFEYIKKTVNVKELETIFKILKSGEEGYFPDLTTCAEVRLRELCPGSKILRTEERLITKDGMGRAEWSDMSKSIQSWESDIKQCEKTLKADSKGKESDGAFYTDCPIRKTAVTSTASDANAKSTSKRIQSTDYKKWDLYDADSETLKIDLDEERAREMNEVKNKRTAQASKLIEEVQIKTKLSATEQTIFANRHRERGNEYFKSGEYKEAIGEYTKSIQISPTAVSFNNRAMAYLKLKMNSKAIQDCDECLKLAPCNTKAMLRKAQGLHDNSKSHEAYNVYHQVLALEPDNKIAMSKIEELKGILPVLPLTNAFRMPIREIDAETDIAIEEIRRESDEEDEDIRPADFSQLIIPNKIVKNKLPGVAKEFEKIKQEQEHKIKSQLRNASKEANKKIDILATGDNIAQKMERALIQEI